MKYWKIFVIVFVSSLLAMLPLRLSIGCGPDLSFDGYSFMNPDIVNQNAAYAPYFLQFDDFYRPIDTIMRHQQKGNLDEWKEIFCDAVQLKDLSQVIYQSSVSQLRSLQTAVLNKKHPLPPRLKANSFARHLKKHQCKETVQYLIFAKECEPHVKRSRAWETPPRDTFAMQILIDEGLDQFMETESNYIRLRYAYQLVRLAHYKKNYVQTLELYDYLMPKTDPMESILNYWIMGHRAGALQKRGNRVEAAYLFSKIFGDCPSKRETAYRSFSIQSDEEWDTCMLMCEDDFERATLYAIRANGKNSVAAKDMDRIYELDPLNKNLELLLVKEIRELERDLLGLEFNDKKRQNKQFHGLPRKRAGEYAVALLSFVIKVVEENKVARPELWQLAAGYLEFLTGDLYAAGKTFLKLKDQITNKKLKEQLEVFMLAHQINSYESIDNEDETEIAAIIIDNPIYKKNKDVGKFLNDRLAYVYKAQNNPGKAFRIHHSIDALKPNPQIEIIEDLLKVCKKEDKSKFEKALITRSDGSKIETELIDMKGTLLLAEGKLEAALEVLKRIPRDERKRYQLNPFIDLTYDCVFNCELPDSMVYYDKVELIQRIFELEYKAKSDLDTGAKYYYELGTAFYNMSYFGYEWKAMDFFRSGANWDYDKDGIFPTYYYPFGNREYRDLNQAMYYFEKARITALDYELGAKAAFMAARCEQKMYFTSKDCKYNSYTNQIPVLPPEYQNYYRLLEEYYSGTAFYNEMIEECKFFAAYVSK